MSALRTLACGVALQLAFSQFAWSSGGSKTLQGFTVLANSRLYEFKATGTLASIGSLMPLIAASQAEIEIREKARGTVSSHQCSSFTFHLNSSFAVCELEGQSQSMVFDLDQSRLRLYPNK